MWTWINGNKSINQRGYFVAKGVAHPNNVPGARSGGCMWEDKNGALCLFGGTGFSSNGNGGIYISFYFSYNYFLRRFK